MSGCRLLAQNAIFPYVCVCNFMDSDIGYYIVADKALVEGQPVKAHIISSHVRLIYTWPIFGLCPVCDFNSACQCLLLQSGECPNICYPN